MGSLLHPAGSQPAKVYWARRGAVLLAVVAVIAALVFVFRPQPSAPVAATPETPSVAPATSAPTVTPSASDSPTASPTPTGPVACDATNSRLALAGYQKVKQDGKQQFTLAVTNSGKETCVLDLKPSTFSLTVASGRDKIWTTGDCDKWVPSHKGSLKAGAAYEFGITWPVVRSAPGCKTVKSLLGTGTYVADAAFTADAKARQVFVVAKVG